MTQTIRKLLTLWLRSAFSRFASSSTDKGHLEVERKFSLSEDEAARVPLRLRELNFQPAGIVRMTDHFLPAAVQGEMLRVRRESLDGEPSKALLTFKQWVATSGGGKERRETERAIGGTIAMIWLILGRIVRGATLLSFSKERRLFEGELAGNDSVVSIDEVTGLGPFSGLYLEVETIIDADSDPSAARNAIFQFVEELFGEKRADIKRSYMDMLVESKQGQ